MQMPNGTERGSKNIAADHFNSDDPTIVGKLPFSLRPFRQ